MTGRYPGSAREGGSEEPPSSRSRLRGGWGGGAGFAAGAPAGVAGVGACAADAFALALASLLSASSRNGFMMDASFGLAAMHSASMSRTLPRSDAARDQSFDADAASCEVRAGAGGGEVRSRGGRRRPRRVAFFQQRARAGGGGAWIFSRDETTGRVRARGRTDASSISSSRSSFASSPLIARAPRDPSRPSATVRAAPPDLKRETAEGHNWTRGGAPQ